MLEDRRFVNILTRMLQLGCQIAAAYIAVNIDGYQSCDTNFIQISSYLSYILIVLNALFVFMVQRSTHLSKGLCYGVLGLDLALVIGLLYLNIEGYNKQNNCAANRVLFSFNFIVTVAALLFAAAIMFANLNWAERYTNWPGNIAWPILMLSYRFQGAYGTPNLIIGVLMAIVVITSFIVNILVYNSMSYTDKKKKLMNLQWNLAMVIMVVCEVLAIIVLIVNGKGGDYNSEQGRKTLVVFAAVNIVDFCFWLWAKSRMGIWSGLPDF